METEMNTTNEPHEEKIAVPEQPAAAVQEKMKLGTPGAIVIAGALIALAVIFSNGGFKMTGSGGTAPGEVKTIAARAGLDISAFNTCLASNKYDAKISAMHKEGDAIGINGTPFSVIVTREGAKIPVVGAQPYSVFKGIIDGLPTVPPLGKSLAIYKLSAMSPVTSADHILGDPNADVMIVEYSDTECPFCKRLEPTLKQLVTDYNGKVAWVYRHYPLDCVDSTDPSCQTLHAKSRHEAAATECAAEIGGNDGFWKYLDALYTATPSNDGFDAQML